MIIEGIVINCFNYSDSSKIIKVLTNDKIHSLLVKGASNFDSKLNFLTNFFAINQYEILEKPNISTVISGENIYNYRLLQEDFLKNKYASLLIFSLKKISESEIDVQDLLRIVKAILQKIANSKNHEEIYFYYNLFLVKSLFYLGINPDTSICSHCYENEHLVHFDIYDGVFLCQDCSETKSLYFTKILKIMCDTDVAKINYSSLTLYNLEKLEKTLKNYIQSNCGIYL